MRIDVASLTSHFPNPQDGFTTTTSGSVSSGAATVGLNSTGDYSNGDVVVLIIDPTDSDKKQVLVGTIDISGSQVTNVAWVGGTNQSHTSGATVVDYYDAAHMRMVTKGILVHADQDGTLKAGAVHSAPVLSSNVVETAKIKNAAVTVDKIAVGTTTTSSSANNRTTTSTTLASLTDSINLTAGKWELELKTYAQITNTSGSTRTASVTLSSDASTETHTKLTQVLGCSVDAVQFSCVQTTREVVTLTGSTTFTLMGKVSGTSTTLSILGASQSTVIEARKLSSETS